MKLRLKECWSGYTPIEEDGKLQGGEKDPCWKGYEMVGMKDKGGAKVPNCVPKTESIVAEGRGLKTLAKELYAVAEHIQGYVEIYKRKKGTPDEKKVILILKKLNAEKKELERRMEVEVSSLYRDAELKIED